MMPRNAELKSIFGSSPSFMVPEWDAKADLLRPLWDDPPVR
jgi:hypothetical protein